MSLGDFAQCTIDRLNSICGVNHTSNSFWEGKQGNDVIPMSMPRFAHGRIFLVSLFREEF